MNPLRCDEIKNSLVEYLEFELPLTNREHFYEHLVHCAQCRSVHDELKQILTDVKNIDVVYPSQAFWDGLPGSVLDEVKHQRSTLPQATTEDVPSSNIESNTVSYDDNKVIVFSKIRSRKLNDSILRSEQLSEDGTKQVSPFNEKHAAAKHWPRVVLSIAAAVLIGIVTTFSLLEKEAIIQDSVGFQAKIQTEQSLADLARKIAPLSQPGNQFGFTSQDILFNEFAIGSMFSEAKAYAKAWRAVELKTHLALLKTALLNETSPQHTIINAIDHLQSEFESKSDFIIANQELTRLLNKYAEIIKEQDDKRYNLVKAGAWTFDYALAVVAQDEVRVKQRNQLAELAVVLQINGVPPGVIKSLNKIQGVVNQSTITSRDYQQILDEVENIRSLLG
ncbi:zf-HC2 domain-containing protein [Kaarinaea lacus]